MKSSLTKHTERTVAFQCQQWLHQRAKMLRCTHNNYVVKSWLSA